MNQTLEKPGLSIGYDLNRFKSIQICIIDAPARKTNVNEI